MRLERLPTATSMNLYIGFGRKQYWQVYGYCPGVQVSKRRGEPPRFIILFCEAVLLDAGIHTCLPIGIISASLAQWLARWAGDPNVAASGPTRVK